MEWIRVKDQLPEEDEIILLWVENFVVERWSYAAQGHYENKSFYVKGGYNPSEQKITHWMPLSKPAN